MVSFLGESEKKESGAEYWLFMYLSFFAGAVESISLNRQPFFSLWSTRVTLDFAFYCLKDSHNTILQ